MPWEELGKHFLCAPCQWFYGALKIIFKVAAGTSGLFFPFLNQKTLLKVKIHKHSWHTFVYIHAQFPRRLPLSPRGVLMSLHHKQEIVTQQKGKWPLCGLPACVYVCLCMSDSVSVFVFNVCTEGEDIRRTGNDHKLLHSSIWGCGLDWSSKISLLLWRWKNLSLLSGSSGSPRGSAQKFVWSAWIHGNKTSVTILVNTRKSILHLLCSRQLVYSMPMSLEKSFSWEIH